MLKEYIIQIDSPEHDKMLVRKLKKLCREYEGEFHVRWTDKDYVPGKLKMVNTNKNRETFWNVKGI